jgi:subtilisin family serine protease
LSIIGLLSFSNVVDSKCVVRYKNTPKKNNVNHISIEDNINNKKYLEFDESIYDKNDKYYLVYVNNTYTEGLNKRQEPNQFVNSVVNEIHELIIDNKDTFKNPNKLESLIGKTHPLKKRDDNAESNIVFEIASVNDVSVLYTYISDSLKEKIRSIPGVRNIEPDKKLNLKLPFDNISQKTNEKSQKVKRFRDDDDDYDFYSKVNPVDNNVDIEAIKQETGWSDVEIRNSTYLHLSLMSQGKFDTYDFERYDSNYYYPKTAGEGIDVYVLDADFNFNQPEFSNVDEREAKCLGIFRNGTLTQADDYALPADPHGELIADAVGGIKHGAAPKANVYGMAVEFDGEEGTLTRASFIKTLESIRKNIPMKPHKSILNISLGQYFSVEEDAETINYIEENFKKLNEMGIVVVVASGNDRNAVRAEFENKKYVNLPCASENVICVGGIDNYGYYSNPRLTLRRAKKTKYIEPDSYIRARFSNYGDEVDILAPGFVHLESVDENKEVQDSVFIGTSFSSPLVAGVAATIMSEHPEIDFNTTSMNAYLTKLGLKDIIEDAKGPNVFINNGKKSLYLHPAFVYDDVDFDFDYETYVYTTYTYEEVVTTYYDSEEATDFNEEPTVDIDDLINGNNKDIKNYEDSDSDSDDEDDIEVVTEYVTEFVELDDEVDSDSE